MSILRPILRPLTQSITRALTRALTAPGGGGAAPLFVPNAAFFGSDKGAAYDFGPTAVFYTDSARTTLGTTAGDLIGSATDLSGYGKHAGQAGVPRPAWNGSRADFASGDLMATANIDFSATDVVTVIACVYKASNADAFVICEHGSNGGQATGVQLSAPPFGSAQGFGFHSRGTVQASVNNSPDYTAPQTRVITGIARVSADTCVLRVDGVYSKSVITDQGTGNYQNVPLYIGAGYNGTNLFFGGSLYRLIIIGRELSESELQAAEAWCGAPASISIASPFKYTFAAMGDSLTNGAVGSVTQAQAFPALINDRQARVVYSNNAGVSGDTTANMLTRKWQIMSRGRPNILSIYGGTNDVVCDSAVQASPAPTTTVFTVGAGKGYYYQPGSWIRVGGVQAQVLSVATDAITLTAALASAPAAAAVVAIDTRKNLTELALYAKAQGVTRIVMIGMHYFNFTAAAGASIYDTVSTESPRNAPIRVWQAGAATDAGAGVVYLDMYDWMKALIVAGTYVQGDCLWHVYTNDQHLSVAGQSIFADALEAKLNAQGWL